MKPLSVILAILSIALSGLFLSAAESTTRPATRPSASAKKKPIPKDWISIESPRQFRFWVPKQWRQVGYNFTLPQASDGESPTFEVTLPTCHASSVEEEAAIMRVKMPKDIPGIKIVKDEPTQLGGRSARLFVYEFSHDQNAKTPDGGSITLHSSLRIYEVITVSGNNTWFFVDYFASPAAFNRGLPFAQKVIDSFEWLDTPPATQPSVGK